MNDCFINTGGITPMKLNLNAPFFQFINTAFDFVILNICFILTCLPVFTIGAALTALYTVTMAEAEDKGLPFTKTYFHTFTRCFIRSSLLFAAASASVPCFFSACFSGFPLKACWHWSPVSFPWQRWSPLWSAWSTCFLLWPGMNVPPGSFYSMPCLSAPPICLLPDCLP